MHLRLIIIASILFLSACSNYGGIGLVGSDAWKLTASPEDKAKYYGDLAAYQEQQRAASEAYAAKIKKEQLAADKAQCADYGIKKGTPAFASCLMQLAQARQQQQMLAEQQRQANDSMALQILSSGGNNGGNSYSDYARGIKDAATGTGAYQPPPSALNPAITCEHQSGIMGDKTICY